MNVPSNDCPRRCCPFFPMGGWRAMWHGVLLPVVLIGCLHGSESGMSPLIVKQVLESTTSQYPPFLAALIERDVADGRLLSSQGAFDFQSMLKVFSNRTGLYQSTTAEAGFEQFLGIWGATVYGGYRFTDGTLPDYYYQQRTNEGGTPALGIKLPLLQDGSIDSRRAAIFKAQLDRQLTEPIIHRQHLDFTRAALLAYFN